jgi:uncharacterized integral membrane protein (TIGR00697 family)
MHDTHHHKPSRLFLVLGGFFITNTILAEFVGAKIFSLERTLGIAPLQLQTFIEQPLDLNLTAGVLLWPFVFVMTDIINEYYGKRGVRALSLLAIGMIVYAFATVYAIMQLEPADWWRTKQLADGSTIDMERSFDAVFGQGLWIVIGSIVAFGVSQLLDVWVFQWLKRRTGERWIWLRATGSTVVSQLLDTFIVLWIAFGIGGTWSASMIASVALVNYTYKFCVALLMTPVVYAVHGAIERYLGSEIAGKMRAAALRGD